MLSSKITDNESERLFLLSNYVTIFRQLLQLLPQNVFNQAVKKHSADKYVKRFNYRQLLTVLLYGQISGKVSLRDIETGLDSQKSKLYHMGLSKISRSNLSHACKHRDCRVLEEVFKSLYSHCSALGNPELFRLKLPVFALDSTVVQLCLSLFPWAHYRQKKGAMKLHCMIDVKNQLPAFIVMTDGKPSDVKIARSLDLDLSSDSILVMDRGYLDFKWFRELDSKKITFVTRAKSNLDYRVLGQHTMSESKTIQSDEIIELVSSKEAYPIPMRLVSAYDEKKGKTIKILTNNFKLAASTIGKIYKSRWKIEEFFRWIKQNLKIKTFIGTSENAVMLQIWAAMIYYLLLFYMRAQTRCSFNLLELARRIQSTLFDEKHLLDLLSPNIEKKQKINEYAIQMNLF